MKGRKEDFFNELYKFFETSNFKSIILLSSTETNTAPDQEIETRHIFYY